ncbi:hypothetical protein ACGYK5_17805 [Sulfitobacter sp. 1A16787]|uniref:hypothetical protein n=1 Tax=Sulfitobacter sp. 1A16787 TaxID=3368571 RepID=UPI0037466549
MTTLSDAARNAAVEAVTDLVDGGTIEFQTAASAVVATLGLSDPAFGAAASGTVTANAITPDTDTTGNASPVTKAVFKAAGGATVWTVPVVEGSPSAGEIGLSSTVFNDGDEAKIISYTHTQPAS